MSSEQAIKAFNDTMVDGIEVTGYVRLPDNAKTAMAIVAAADYRLTFKSGYESPYNVSEWQSAIQKLFYDQPEFLIRKKTKKSEREVDLKPLVYVLEVSADEDEHPSFFLKLSAGSTDNIKPELVLASLYEKLGIPFEEQAIQIHRLEVYARDEQEALVPLLDLGDKI
jgi:radical SAM-linked protein